MLYIFVILTTLVISTTLSLIMNFKVEFVSISYAVFAPLSVIAYVLVVLGVLALLTRWCIPKRVWNYRFRVFKVHKWEVKLLQKLGIRKWKDKIPEMGWTAGFEKANIKSLEVKYLGKFLQETVYAEVMHLWAGILGFTALFIFPMRDLYFTVPILIVNFVLHLLPCLIQRYTRYRLAHIYEHKVKVAEDLTILSINVNENNINL